MEKQDKGTIKIGVTGATGLVGRDLVQTLVAAGYQVRALARQKVAEVDWARNLGGAHFTWQHFDLADPREIDAAVDGLDVLIHAAGFVDPTAPRDEIFAINCEGTKKVFAACTAAGVKQFIHISSLSVITGQGDQYDLDEKAPLLPCGESYADSKVEAERFVTAQKGSMQWTVLRPGFIYGPGERSWMPRVIESIGKGKMVLVDGGKRDTNVVYVGNLSLAAELSLLNPVAYGQVFNLTDGEKIDKKTLFDTIADGMGLARVGKDLPRWLVKPVFAGMGLYADMAGADTRARLARFSPGAYRLVAVNQGFSVAKAERMLDYTAAKGRTTFADGMKKTLATMKSAK